MKRKRLFVIFFALFISNTCFMGCAEDRRPTQISDSDKAEEVPEKETEETAETKPERREIPIDFPFYGEQEGNRLVLAAPEEGQDAYELIYYDKDGSILQQINCGKLQEPVTFSFDGLAYGSQNDLQIFPEGGDTGILFIRKDGLFVETPVEIPRYEEIRDSGMLVIKEDEKLCEKIIYLLNEDKNRIEEARRYELQKDTGTLTIRDELEQIDLVEGVVRLDGNGNPINEEYFEMLLWDDVNRLYDYKEEDIICAWVGEEPKQREAGEEIAIGSFDEVQNNWFGNAGHSQEYESRQAFLADFGFEDSEPVYQYFDRYGNVQLELYADEDMQEVCGITYDTCRFNTDLEKVIEIRNAFFLCAIPEAEWNGRDPFLLESVYGTSPEEDSYVVDYGESTVYTDSGKPDLFLGRGRLSDREEEEDMLKINFIYREDGTLFCKEYSHHDLVFGSTLCSLDSFYDTHERLIYERGYITHGHLEYYYIYEDRDGKTAEKPTYILEIDYNLDYAIPNMIKCR